MAYPDSNHDSDVPPQTDDVSRLISMSEELARIASRIVDDRAEATVMTAADSVAEPVNQHEQLLCLARDIYNARRQRARVFDAGALFGEPAWDILLDLFIAELSEKALSVTAACIGAAVPTSTGLRWLTVLEEQGLIRRESDPRDARRVFLRLTQDGFERMTTYMTEIHTPARPSLSSSAAVLRLVR